MLEMDRLERQLVNLPLLQDPSSYIPDTVDLTEDALAREYWLYCFEEALDGVGLCKEMPLFYQRYNLICRCVWVRISYRCFLFFFNQFRQNTVP